MSGRRHPAVNASVETEKMSESYGLLPAVWRWISLPDGSSLPLAGFGGNDNVDTAGFPGLQTDLIVDIICE